MHIQKKYIENTKNLCCGISYEVKLLLDVSCITTDPIVIIPIKPIARITPPIIITFLLCLPECKKNNVIPVDIFGTCQYKYSCIISYLTFSKFFSQYYISLILNFRNDYKFISK